MKKLFTAAFVTLCVASVSAQYKLDNQAREYLEAYRCRMAAVEASGAAMPLTQSEPEQVHALIILEDESDADALAARGYVIEAVRGGVARVVMPIDDVEVLADEDYVRQISFGGRANILMDKGRADTGVDAIHTAAGLNTAYKGAGVMVGLHDTGLDPNHINFMDADGKTRVKGILVSSGSSGATAYYETDRKIRNFTTENASETHGTHVLGIMTGSYAGEATYAGTAAKTTGDMPYYGIAPEADIAVSCGDLYNTCILNGVEYVLQKAKETNRPAVINLSLGINAGSHDGLDAFSRQLDSYGEDAIILISAGNEGDIPMSVAKTFTATDKTLMTSPLPHVQASNGAVTNVSSAYNGTIEIYASDARPLKFKLAVYTRKGMGVEEKDAIEINASTGGKKTYVGGSSTGATYTKLTNFDAAASSTSSLNVSSNIANGRYSLTINHTLDMSSGTDRSFLALVIEGEEGQTVNIYGTCNNQGTTGVYSTFTDRGLTGWSEATCNGTINNMACGKNIIAVGAYTSRASWKTITGGTASFGYQADDIAPFSSYGTLYDGRNLPHITAPGSQIISSYSAYYNKLNENSAIGIAYGSGASRNYHWNPMQGTSMSCPFAAGVVALWLQADPTLKVADVRDIMQQTARRDAKVTAGDPVQWGAGKIDALAGLQEVLRRAASVGSVFEDEDRQLILRHEGESLQIFMAGAARLTATLTAMGGQTVASISGNGDSLTIDTTPLAHGIYVVTAATPTGIASRKVVL